MSEPPSPSEVAIWLDGPKLVEWLRQHGLTEPQCQLSKAHANSLPRWERGHAANVYAVDEVLIKLGRHLSELPDSLFLKTFATRKGSMSTEAYERLQRGLFSGAPLKAIAREVGCAVSTVRYHRNRLQPVA